MKKILAAIDGLKPSRNTVDFAIQLAGDTHAQLVGVFLDDYRYHSYKIYELIGEQDGISEKQKTEFDERDKQVRLNASLSFQEACTKAGVDFKIHHDRNIAIRELIHESMFADLLVIDSKETLTHYEESMPTNFVKSLLTQVGCPVILAPLQYRPFENISLLYDGKPDALYAIKMFSYLVPDLRGKHIEIIEVETTSKTRQNPDNRLLKEFIKRHFPEATFKILKGQPETEIIKYLLPSAEQQLIVLGAYKRSTLSRWLKPSLADSLMKQLDCPLFIAHN